MILPPDVAERAADFAGRGWVAREVADWLDHGTERFLVVTGEPGSGKTALAAWLAGAGPAPTGKRDAAALKRVRAAWSATHFCIPRRDGTVDAAAFATLIAGQLAVALAPDYLPAVARANDVAINATVTAETITAPVTGVFIKELVIAAQSRADAAASVTGLWQGAVRKPLQELASTPPGPTAVILVDALDEAARVQRPNIVSLVAGSDDFPPGVRFVVTMSPDLDGRAIFPGARIVDLSGPASQANANDDIRAFVRMQLKPARDIEDRLVEAAAGNFLYIRFLIDEVERGDRSLDSLEGLPNGLFSLYSTFLDRMTETATGEAVGPGWGRELQPLLGCISVASPSAPRAILPGWLKKDDAKVSQLLEHARQVTEADDSVDGPGHRLYHRSMSDFLAAAQYESAGARVDNQYHTAPEAQHARIAQHYLRNFNGRDWRVADAYGLRHVVRHMAAAAGAEALPVERRRRTAELYQTVLDADFQAAQKATLGDLERTLDDLRIAIETALAGDEIVPLLQSVAGYRRVARSGGIAAGIFEAVDRGDFTAAIHDAEHYGPPPRPRGRWARVLDAWIAWQAARAGRPDDARLAAEGVVGHWLTKATEAEPLYWELCRALVVRAGRSIVAGGGDPAGLVDVFPDERARLLADITGPAATPLADAEAAALLGSVVAHLDEVDRKLRDDPNAAMEGTASGPEYEAYEAMRMRDALVRLAPRPEGQDGIDRTLGPTLTNPYARYRDIGLVAIGTAVAAVPDDDWSDRRLRSILLAGLDIEGVTFTFDVPTLLVAEAERRHRKAGPLAAYLGLVEAHIAEPDRWGTGIRALSARAAGSLANGDTTAARATLVEASGLRVGFAGYAALTYLALADRCLESGLAAAPMEAIWGPTGTRTLIDLARDAAHRVNDAQFREERVALVERYAGWLAAPPPDFKAVLDFVAMTPDPDARRTYKDFAAATWRAAATPDAFDWLKALVPMVLEDTTTLDLILARVIGGSMPTLSDRELSVAIQVAADGLTDGRPWDLGMVAGPLAPPG